MKSAKPLFCSTVGVLLISAAWAISAEQAAGLDGAQLFQTKVCFSCHGADGRTPIMPIYPKVSGQHADYTYNQLRDIKSGARSAGQAAVMMGIMANVSDEEMRAIAEWLATQ